MGEMKEKEFENEAKKNAAIEIAIKVGLLAKCENCDEVHDNLSINYEDADKLANTLITNNSPLVEIFDGNRNELTDLIKDITNDFSKECYCTSKLKNN